MRVIPTNSVRLPLSGTVNKLDITVNSFSLFPTSIEVLWKLSGETAIKEGALAIPKDIVSSWGTDDTIIKDYVLEQLGLLEDLTPEPVVIIPSETTVVTEEPVVEEQPTTNEEPIV